MCWGLEREGLGLDMTVLRYFMLYSIFKMTEKGIHTNVRLKWSLQKKKKTITTMKGAPFAMDFVICNTLMGNPEMHNRNSLTQMMKNVIELQSLILKVFCYPAISVKVC